MKVTFSQFMNTLKEVQNEVDRAATMINTDKPIDEGKMQLAKNMATLQATLEILRK